MPARVRLAVSRRVPPRRVAVARRAVVAGLLAVLAATVGLNVALDTAKPEWRDPEYGWRQKRVRAMPADKPLVLVLGSSRAEMGLSPAAMGLSDATVFNAAQSGCGPVYELLNLKRYLAAGVKPAAVLVEILPPVLTDDTPGGVLTEQPHRLGVADLPRLHPYLPDPVAVTRGWLRARLAPWYAVRMTLVSQWLPRWLPWQQRQDFMWNDMLADGWLPYPFAEITADRRADGTAQARGQYAPYLADFRVAPLPRRVYADLIRECEANGIRVAFFVMPESPTFRGWYPPAARAAIDAYFVELRVGVPVFDCHAWLTEETAFADTHHLMRPGAEAFSRRFAAECVGPWLADPPRPGSTNP